MNKREIEILNTLGELYEYWRAHPELRLGQILYNFSPEPNYDVYYTVDSYYRIVLEQANKAANRGRLQAHAVQRIIDRALDPEMED